MSRRRRLILFAGLVAALAVLLLGPATPPAPAAPDDRDVAPGRVLVKPRSARAASAVRAERARFNAEAVEDHPGLGLQVWHVPPGSERAVSRQLAQRRDVEYAEPDGVQRVSLVPTDPYFANFQWNLAKVNLPAAWDLTTGDPAIKVAVIDSGFDTLHPDRPANLELGCDYVSWRAFAFAGSCPVVQGDESGHGTHVAGIVAARQNNAVGITGVAPNVTLLAIRTADAAGVSYSSDVSAAIREAANAGARVINLSLGGTSSSRTQQEAINYALGRGAVVIAAAGNEYAQGNPTTYPAAYPGVLAVGSASDTDEHAWFSNTGPYLSLVAPGGSALTGSDPDVRHWILSLYPVTKGAYQFVEGTSQAAPHVAGVAGLMFSLRPQLSGTQVSALLQSTARPLGGSVPNDTFGYGHVDGRAAVQAAADTVATPISTPPGPTPTSTPPGPTPTPTAMPTPIPVPALPAGWTREYLPNAVRAGA